MYIQDNFADDGETKSYYDRLVRYDNSEDTESEEEVDGDFDPNGAFNF